MAFVLVLRSCFFLFRCARITDISCGAEPIANCAIGDLSSSEVEVFCYQLVIGI